MGRGLLPVPLCALLLHASVGSREQAQPPLPLLKRYPEPHGQVTAYNRSPVH